MPVRILGEDLVAYRDLSGSYGLVARHCAHRRADLAFDILEEDGLRCSYHGWCFDRSGRCTDQPYEQTVNPRSKFTERASIDAYLLRERAGTSLLIASSQGLALMVPRFPRRCSRGKACCPT
jgi:5,5'-dehydrodivanillate O-demethylase